MKVSLTPIWYGINTQQILGPAGGCPLPGNLKNSSTSSPSKGAHLQSHCAFDDDG